MQNNTDSNKEEYEQFGDEWKKEMMKFRKDDLVKFLKEKCIRNLELTSPKEFNKNFKDKQEKEINNAVKLALKLLRVLSEGMNLTETIQFYKRVRNCELFIMINPEGNGDDQFHVDTALETASDIIENLIDDEPCRLDPHGFCQEHAWMSAEPCPQKTAKEFLKFVNLPY